MEVIVLIIPNLLKLTVVCNQDVSTKIKDYEKRFPGVEYFVCYSTSDEGNLNIEYKGKNNETNSIINKAQIKARESIKGIPIIFEQLTYFFDIEFDNNLQDLEESSIYVKHYLSEFAESFYRHGRSIRGQFSFVNEPGQFRLEVVYKKGKAEKSFWFDFTVASTKMDVINDYRSILKKIEDWDRNLVFYNKAKTLHEVQRLAASTDPKETQKWVVFFDKTLDVYEKALRRILYYPNNQMISSTFFHRADQVKRWTIAMSRDFAKHKNDLLKLEKHKFVDTVRELTFDTRENRFVKFTLFKLISLLQTARNAFEEDTDYSREFVFSLEKRIERFKRYMRTPKLSKVGVSSKTVNSLVMQMRPGYSDIRAVWNLMNSLFTSDISLSGKRLSFGFAKLSILYEFWCFLAIKEILDDITEQYGIVSSIVNEAEAKQAIAAATADENIPSKAPIAYTYLRDDGSKLAELLFQQSYGPNFNAETFADPFLQRPDIVVRFWNQDRIYTYLFDAKYRIENSNLTGNKEAAPRDSIDQMHRYRDAILWRKKDNESVKREIIGAYILFPADINKCDQIPIYTYDSLIAEQNIGAFPLLPQKDKVLRDFLSSLIKRIIESDNSAWLLEENQIIAQKGFVYSIDHDEEAYSATLFD